MVVEVEVAVVRIPVVVLYSLYRLLANWYSLAVVSTSAVSAFYKTIV